MADVALGSGAVWVVFRDGRLVKIDPRTRRQVDETDVEGSLDVLVVGAGGIWTFDITHETLTRFDSRTLDPAAPVQVGGSILAMAADDERVWLLEASGDVVIPVASDGTKLGPIPVGEDPSGIAVGLDAVWVADEGGSVYRIDPITFGVTSIHPGGHLTAIAVDEDDGTLSLAVGAD